MKAKTSSDESASHAPAISPCHPGHFVRDTVLTPKRMSVTLAAKIVGVGRPALSNFLNGNVAATPDMASRIERAFRVPAETLLDMQATYDAAHIKTKGAPSNTKSYVPPYLSIRANDIEQWASPNISARIRLAVLLRTLVNSTGVGLKKVDFPGNDDAERAGWDGFIEAAEGTPWVPEGLSGWEFGTDKKIKEKADKDFAKSIVAVGAADRRQTAFVFVTPRRWPGKASWVSDNKNKGQWKDVRAYDASDIEQWLEQSIAGQAWFANETHRPSNGVRSLDKSWSDWSSVSSPPLAEKLFASAIDQRAKLAMRSYLSQPPQGPTIVAADSIEEALAFLAQLFGEAGDDLAAYRDRVLVFDEPGVLPKLAQGAQNFIAIAPNRDVERELAPFARSMHTIVVYPRNAANADPHIVLEPLNYTAFRTALESMGFTHDQIQRYNNESGRSLTVLRRRLSTIPAVRTPAWAADEKTATGLIPFLVAGAWSSVNATDQAALMLLADQNSYEKLEKEAQRLARLNDAPIWSVGPYRGVISKIDLLFAVSGSITSQDLKRYFNMARIVLGEDDPKLDLPEKDRWAASIHGKWREFSGALREGISETLVLLAVHGNHLFHGRLGLDTEDEAKRLVRDLLTPLTTRTLESHDRDLPTYAEAAPEAFLAILEDDLKAPQPASFGLMRPIARDIFGSECARTGLLWALENLAWSPDALPRVVLILGRLAQIEIEDNWVNKPIESLKSIFRVWMPQTAASHDQRLAAMKLLADKFPDVAWRVCVDQLDTGHRTGHYSHKPRWRTDAHGFGEPFTKFAPIIAFRNEIIELVLGWAGHSREMLCDLIEHLHDLDDKQQAAVWALVKLWADAPACDADKAWVREKIRITVMSRRGLRRSKGTDAAHLSNEAKSAYQALEPTDLLNKHEWLFREVWVEESADELHNDEMDFHKRDERISKRRADALREIIAAQGTSGIFELAEMGKAASQIGWLMGTDVLKEVEVADFILGAMSHPSNTESWAKRNLIHGTLRALHDEKKRDRVLNKVKKKLSQADMARVLTLGPFRRSTWRLVDILDEDHRKTYWEEVMPDWAPDDESEINEAVERLLAARRPRAAFACVHYKLEKLKVPLLFRLMSEVPREGKDQPGHHQLDSYYIQNAFRLIDKSTELTLEQKARLEFTYIDILSQPWSSREGYGIPNLEKYVEAHPGLFVQAIVWTYKRKGLGEDPPELRAEPENVQHLAERGYKLLDGLERMPGHDYRGDLNAETLAAWVKAVRDACAELDRGEIGDTCIGKLFSNAPKGSDDVWPCEPVRQVIEIIQSKSMSRGACTGLYNARGAHWRGEGGDDERKLAEKYRAWADSLQYSHPFVASAILMEMVRTYEHEAIREDAEAGIRRRLQ